MVIRDMLEQLKRTIVFLCIESPEGSIKTEKGNYQTVGTGFLVQIEGVNHLVTAKHVVTVRKGNEELARPMFLLCNTKKGHIRIRNLSALIVRDKIRWVCHDNPGVDVALLPVRLSPEEEDVITIPEKYFCDLKHLCELDDVFSLSFQPGADNTKIVHPIIRTGTISRINQNGTFMIDSNAFPGNSGSPVFTRPLPGHIEERPKGKTKVDAPPPGYFIGIIGAYLPYRDPAISVQTGRPRIIFEENTGLCICWSVAFLNEIIASKAFKEQLKYLKKLK